MCCFLDYTCEWNLTVVVFLLLTDISPLAWYLQDLPSVLQMAGFLERVRVCLFSSCVSFTCFANVQFRVCVCICVNAHESVRVSAGGLSPVFWKWSLLVPSVCCWWSILNSLPNSGFIPIDSVVCIRNVSVFPHLGHVFLRVLNSALPWFNLVFFQISVLNDSQQCF